MKDIGKFLGKFTGQKERNWLFEQLRKRGVPISRNNDVWNEAFLFRTIQECVAQDSDLLRNLLNNWRQHKYKVNQKKAGAVTFQVTISKDTNLDLMSLQKQSKLPKNVVIEHLIKDTFQSEMTEQRLQTLRLNEIKLSEKLAKKNKVSFQNLSNRLNKITNGAKIADELASALSQVDELSIDKEVLNQKLKALEISLSNQTEELKKLKSSLSAEKRINSKLMQELKEARD